jgi:apolipoprotein N-acyltransferase
VLLRGWVFGVGHFTVGNNWIQHAFDYQDKMPPVLGYFAVVLLALYLALYPAIAMGLAWRFARSVPAARWNEPDIAFVLAAAAAWILGEYLRGTLFTGYPWNPLGVVWVPTPIAQLAGMDRHLCLSGLTLLRRGALLATQRQYRVPLSLPALLLVPGSRSTPAARSRTCRDRTFRVVQPNIGQDGVDAPIMPERVLATNCSNGAASPADRRGCIVWPEGMVNYFIEDGYPHALLPPRRSALGTRADRHLLGPRMRDGSAATRCSSARAASSAGAGNSVWVLDPGACWASATTRRISCPTANICRCARCWRRSASRGS